MMKTDSTISGWVVVIVLLILVIIAGGIFIGLNYGTGGPVEISLAPAAKPIGEVFIGGDVHNPGYYSLYEGDDITGLIAAAGGITGEVASKQVQLTVRDNDSQSLQLININTAETWLLESLPGIGAVKARAIVDYREAKGHFRYIHELMEVEGIGPASFDNIRHLITVSG